MITPKRQRRGAVWVCLALLAWAGVAAGGAAEQKRDTRKEYALIFGTVWTAQERPAYGIPIKIRRAEEKKARWELVSDHNGEFAQRVPTGKQDYVVWADIKTAKGKAKPQTTVHIENDERADISLHLTE